MLTHTITKGMPFTETVTGAEGDWLVTEPPDLPGYALVGIHRWLDDMRTVEYRGRFGDLAVQLWLTAVRGSKKLGAAARLVAGFGGDVDLPEGLQSPWWADTGDMLLPPCRLRAGAWAEWRSPHPLDHVVSSTFEDGGWYPQRARILGIPKPLPWEVYDPEREFPIGCGRTLAQQQLMGLRVADVPYGGATGGGGIYQLGFTASEGSRLYGPRQATALVDPDTLLDTDALHLEGQGSTKVQHLAGTDLSWGPIDPAHLARALHGYLTRVWRENCPVARRCVLALALYAGRYEDAIMKQGGSPTRSTGWTMQALAAAAMLEKDEALAARARALAHWCMDNQAPNGAICWYPTGPSVHTKYGRVPWTIGHTISEGIVLGAGLASVYRIVGPAMQKRIFDCAVRSLVHLRALVEAPGGGFSFATPLGIKEAWYYTRADIPAEAWNPYGAKVYSAHQTQVANAFGCWAQIAVERGIPKAAILPWIPTVPALGNDETATLEAFLA